MGLHLGSLLLSLIMPTLFDWEASGGGGTTEKRYLPLQTAEEMFHWTFVLPVICMNHI